MSYPTSIAGRSDGQLHRLDALVLVHHLHVATGNFSPAGFTSTGCRWRSDRRPPSDEWSLLQLAHAFEQATGHGKRRPAIV
jgi:hypothetical protein